MLAAIVPAIKSGMTCPNPKQVSNSTPIIGLPFCAIHPNKTAKTGVEHGDDARPNARPVATGANGAGTLSCQAFGSGPCGSGNLKSPRRLRPISTAKIATNLGKNIGIWP